ncbi:thermonuclease family protein [Azospirillum sp. RWY-5-1]|uniref:Thermonuclease family protein n=1 Tax=Azospirillum oleiclasticum TaxID=2735135 RepID=A0ABX2T5A6_9PROT|nr:thermonuclease family protein [Azospirillum oleiclasticum]NYZ12339.1 thermonuclease family protein [Azospirillum oleiclasticum]NYZ19499.1 thermonuclease family protein [Azospirillum oleiclasticum]
MSSRRCSERLAAVITLLLLATPAAAQTGRSPASPSVPNQRVTGTGIAVEGDLLTVNGRPVRLMGIDAPDPGQTCLTRGGRSYDCFASSTAVLRGLIQGGEVECTVADRDRNGQEMGECRVSGVDLGRAMVLRGWAFAYRSLSPAYQEAEAYAVSRRLGLWAGKVEKPWQWRSRKLLEAR